MKLLAGIWENSTSANLLGLYESAVDVGIRWSLDSFGLDRLQFTVKVRNRDDLYYRLKNDLGKRAGLVSGSLRRPISGHVVRAEPAGAGRIMYDVRGAGAIRMEDSYEQRRPQATQTISTTIENMITNHVTAVSTDFDNIATNSTALGGVIPDIPIGDLPKDWIKKLLAMGDSGGNIYDFWLVDAPLINMKLEKWIAYYARRNLPSTSGTPVWLVHDRDTADGIRLSHSIEDVYSNVTIWYGTITGTVTTANTPGVNLIDSAATFFSDGVQPGDKIANTTSGAYAQVARVASETQLVCSGLVGGLDDRFDLSDEYSIQLQQPLASTNDFETATYWTRLYSEMIPWMTSTQADQYRDALLASNADAHQVAPFTIAAPYITNDDGGTFPLWDLITYGGGYVRLADLNVNIASFNNTLNSLNTFRVTSADYDHNARTLRVSVDSPDKRLDAQLARQGLLTGTIIQRG